MFVVSYRAATRVKALQEINVKLERRLFFDFVDERKVTFADIVERSLRRGKPAEQVLAARLFSLLCVQLGVECGEIYEQLRPVLLTTFSDTTVPAVTRGAV